MCPPGMEKNVGTIDRTLALALAFALALALPVTFTLAQVGTMDATQFRGTLGTLLGGAQLHMRVIDAICDAYGTEAPSNPNPHPQPQPQPQPHP